MSEITIDQVVSAADLEAVRDLLLDYARAIPPHLQVEEVRSEAQHLPGSYAPPRGALLLARDVDTGEPLGCVAIRPLPGPGDCEVRRLFVRPGGRGRAIGFKLGFASIATAKAAGYKRMLLETHESMIWSNRICEEIGFHAIAPYYANPSPGTLYLALDLTTQGG